MKPGSLILARLQQSDGALKSRPAIILSRMPPYNDLLIAAISSRLGQAVRGFDEVVQTTDADFEQTGLKVASVIRLGMIATIPATSALGQLGSVFPERHQRLLRRLAQHLAPTAPTSVPS
jgi:mRNA interferase MazF